MQNHDVNVRNNSPDTQNYDVRNSNHGEHIFPKHKAIIDFMKFLYCPVIIILYLVQQQASPRGSQINKDQ